MPYARSSQIYDQLYMSMKDYEAESKRLHTLIQQYLRSGGRDLLNIGAGTGLHDQYLARWYNVTGLDLTPEMLAVARRRNPHLTYHQGDMTDFDLGRQYDVITNLFSAIGHVPPDKLGQTIQAHARHLAPGGVLVIEPWIMPHMLNPNHVSYNVAREHEEDPLVVRVSRTTVEGNVCHLELHFLVTTPERTEHFVEHHELTMFTEAEFGTAFESAGLEWWYLSEGLSDNGRGVFIARRPNS